MEQRRSAKQETESAQGTVARSDLPASDRAMMTHNQTQLHHQAKTLCRPICGKNKYCKGCRRIAALKKKHCSKKKKKTLFKTCTDKEGRGAKKIIPIKITVYSVNPYYCYEETNVKTCLWSQMYFLLFLYVIKTWPKASK